MNIRNLTWLAAAIVIAGGTSVRAQGVTVELTGVITSTAGGPVDGAVIQIRNAETGFLRMATADANGRYRAVALPVGPYFVTVTKGGFKAAANARITLTLTSAAPLNIKLAPEAGATVEVIATEAAIDSERASAAAFISTDDLKNMPTLNRSFTGLATLTPQVIVEGSRGSLAIAGQRGVNTSINIDGGDNNEPFFGGALGSAEGKTPFTVSIEAIREYQVITDGASAEYGRMGGGYVNAVTKSGTNDLTGGLFYYTRPKSMVAKGANLTGVVGSNDVRDFKQDQFGFSLGGPIVKDQLFYFVVYDAQRRNDPINFQWGGSTPVTLDPTTYPNDAALVSRGYNYTPKSDSDVVSVRFDYTPTTAHTFTLRLNQSNFKGSAYTGTSNAYENSISDDIKTMSAVISWNWVIGSNFMNELKVNYAKDEMPRKTRGSIPQVQINDVGYYGANPYPREYETKRLQITENFTYWTTTLQVKAGIDFNRIDVAETFSAFYQGFYNFRNLNDFRSGNWNYYRQRFSLQPGLDGWAAGKFDATEDQVAVYVQTDWRPIDSLKVGLGLRYDRQTHPNFPVANYDNRLANPIPVNQSIPTANDFSPRLSLTWTPDFDKGRTVIRGSFGRYVTVSPSVFLYQAYTANGIRMAQVQFSSSQAAQFGIPRGSAWNANNPYVLPSIIPAGATVPAADLFTFSPDFKNAKADRLNLGGERAFGPWVLSLSGTYAKTKNLERVVDLNLAAPTQNAYGRWVHPSARPNTTYRQLAMYVSDVESRYHAYTVGAKYDKADSPFTAQINYTYSILKDHDSNERNFSSYSTQTTSRLQDEWSYGDTDRRHNLTGQFQYNDRRWTGIVAGIAYRYISGSPYSLTYGSDMNADGVSGNDRFYINGQDSGRNTQRRSSNMYIDVRLSRDIPLWKKAKLTISADIFNILNRQDVYRLSFVSSSNDTGGVSSDANPILGTRLADVGISRQVQLGARISF